MKCFETDAEGRSPTDDSLVRFFVRFRARNILHRIVITMCITNFERIRGKGEYVLIVKMLSERKSN